ncbi:hypothetical protein ACHQM5_030645 [Ranunculus cassubicifolius]
MISIGGGLVTNLCCYCTHTLKTSNIITKTSSKNNFGVVLWKNHLANQSNNSSSNLVIVPSKENPPATRGGGEALVLLMVMMIFLGSSPAATAATIEDSMDTMSNVPQTLSGDDCKKERIQRPKSRDAERCTAKCVTACIRGGPGSPGEAPLNAMRPLVIFKEGFHSRRYCLVECSDICNLIKDGDDGP